MFYLNLGFIIFLFVFKLVGRDMNWGGMLSIVMFIEVVVVFLFMLRIMYKKELFL